MVQLTQRSTFNQEPSAVNEPNYLGASAGTSRAETAQPVQISGITSLPTPRFQADTSTGDFLTNIAKTGTLAVHTANQLIEDQAKEEVRNVVEPIRAQFTADLGMAVNAAEAAGSSSAPSVTQDGSSSEVPQGVQSGIKTVQRLENARTTKQLTEADFALRLDTELSRLKNQYAGHKDLIDQEASRILGFNPANQVWRSRLNALTEMAAKANSAQDKQIAFIEKMKGYTTPEEVSNVLTGKMPFEQFQHNTLVRASQEGVISRAVHEANYYSTTKEQSTEVMTTAGYKQGSLINDKALDALDASVKAQGFDLKNLGKIGTADIEPLLNSVRNARTQAENALREWLSTPTEFRLPNGEVRQDTIGARIGKNLPQVWAEFNRTWDNMEAKIYKQDGGVIHQQKILNDLTRQNGTRELNETVPGAKYIDVIRDKWGDTGFGIVMSLPAGPDQKPLVQSQTDYLRTSNIGRALYGPYDNIGQAAKDRASKGEKNPAVFRDMFDGPLKAITTPEVPLKERMNAAKKLFNEETFNTFYANQNEEGRANMYSKLVSSTTVDAMYRLKGTDPNLWDQYQAFVVNAWKARHASTVAGATDFAQGNVPILSGGEPAVSVTIDPTSHRVKAVPAEGADIPPDLAKAITADKRINALNAALDELKPIADVSGSPFFNEQVLYASGFNPKASAKTPVARTVLDYFNDYRKRVQEQTAAEEAKAKKK